MPGAIWAMGIRKEKTSMEQSAYCLGGSRDGQTGYSTIISIYLSSLLPAILPSSVHYTAHPIHYKYNVHGVVSVLSRWLLCQLDRVQYNYIYLSSLLPDILPSYHTTHPIHYKYKKKLRANCDFVPILKFFDPKFQ